MRARVARTGLALAVAASLGACSWLGAKPEPPKPAENAGPLRYGLFSQLKSLDSGVWGRARVVDRGDGLQVTVAMINMPQGAYRLAFGERANCNSPNGFSAGPPWAPASAGKDARNLMPVFYSNSQGNAEASVFVRGVHVSGPDGVENRSILVYTGLEVADVRPDAPNNRVACGTFEPAKPFEF